MLKLRIAQNTVDYHGFFGQPAFELMGDARSVVQLLYNTFAVYGVSLTSLRLDGDAAEPSTAMAVVRLGRRGVYRFKFDQIQATLADFDDEQLTGFVEALQLADEYLRATIKQLSMKTHAFFYSSHSMLSEGTSIDFFRRLPGAHLPVPGEDMGSGVIQNWRDLDLGARFSLTLDHSLAYNGGVFLNYRVVLDRDRIDYAALAAKARHLLTEMLASMGLELDEGENI